MSEQTTMQDDSANSAEESSPKFDKEQLFQEFLSSQKFKDILNAEKGKAVESFQKEKMPEMVQASVKAELENREKKTPEQLALEETQREIKQLKQEREQERKALLLDKNKGTVLSTLKEKNLTPLQSLVDFVADSDDEATTTRLNTLVESVEKLLKQSNAGSLGSGKSEIPSNTSEGGVNEPGPNASDQEWMDYYKENPL